MENFGCVSLFFLSPSLSLSLQTPLHKAITGVAMLVGFVEKCLKQHSYQYKVHSPLCCYVVAIVYCTATRCQVVNIAQ